MAKYLDLVLAPPDDSLIYSGSYDPLLVTLSVMAAAFASFAALQVAHQIPLAQTPWSRRLWIATGGIAMGAGIWAMHFVGMLALSLPCTTGYDATLTLISVVPGILAAALAIQLLSRERISWPTLVLGGLLLGSGIGAMHYTGMAAYRLDGVIRYDARLFALSILVAVLLAILALWVKFRLQPSHAVGTLRVSMLAATIMGLAISAMHYTGMAAAYFVRDGTAAAIESPLGPSLLAAVVLVIASAIILVALVATFLAGPNPLVFAGRYRLLAAMLVGWSLISWMVADYYSAHRQIDAYSVAKPHARQEAESLAANIVATLTTQQGVAQILADSAPIRDALRRFGPDVSPSGKPATERTRTWSQDPGLAQVNGFLATAVASVDGDAFWLLNAAGDCVAASNAGEPRSRVGASYAERDFFRNARAGKPQWQYVPGKTSSLPGLAFAYPVFDRGRFVGAVAVKREIADLRRWTQPLTAFLSDANGVIVLAEDQEIQHRRLPQYASVRIDAATRDTLYRKMPLDPAPIAKWRPDRFDDTVLVGNRLQPAILASRHLPAYGISVHVPHATPELMREAHEKHWLFLLVALSGNLLIVATATLLLYFAAMREARAAADRASRDLEDQVRLRTAELLAARDAAESATRSKSAFLANMSHEIRTPLNAITGLAHLLRRDGVTPQQSDRLEKIEQAGKHLLAIINNVLDLSKIEAEKFSLEAVPVNLAAIAGHVVSMLADKAQAKGLALAVEAETLPAPLLGDPTRLQQALLNYATNAVKFTERGSVRLRILLADRSTDHATIRFEVVDTGPGIDADDADRLFAAFEQADNSTTRKHGGTGLGLAITRKLAELMGGSAGVASVPGQGSTFWFTARLALGRDGTTPVGAAQSDSAERTLIREHAGRRILLVEDDVINREIALEFLADAALTVDVANDGIEAVAQVAANDYDLILMDMQMPRLDGVEATRRIRATERGRWLPIIAMTANAFAEDRDRCLAVGMNDFIAKPVDPDLFFSVLLRWLDQDAGPAGRRAGNG